MDISWEDLLLAIIWAEYALLVLASLVGAIRFRRLPLTFRLVCGMVWLSLVIESLSKAYLLHWIVGSNHYLLHVYTIGEIWLVLLLYRELLLLPSRKKRLYGQIGLGIAVLVTGYSAVALIDPEMLPTSSVQWASKVVVNGSVIGLACWLLVRIFTDPATFMGRPGVVLLNSGFLLFYTGSFIVYLAVQLLLTEDLDRSVSIWIANALLIFVLYAIYLLSLWQAPRRSTP